MNTRQRAYEILEDFQTTMLVTTGANGRLDARPMRLIEVEPAGAIWLLTSVDAKMVNDVNSHGQVLLVCQSEGKEYLSIRGSAQVVDDRPRLRRVWSELYNVWFPDGPDDPSARMLAITPTEAEFWEDGGTNRLRYLWEAAKVMAGEPTTPPEDPGEHGRTTL